MSPERPITNDTGGVSSTTSIGGARLEPSANMVISSIPLETILQQHLQNSKTNNSSNSVNIISNNSNSGYSNNNQTYTINLNGISQSNMTITSSSNSPATTISAPSSKLVLLHQNHGSDNYAVASDSSNVGNIVLVATEKMEMINTDHDIINNNVISGNHRNVNNVATDEELTPLTWLHDKNLLKGINLSKVQTTTSPESPRQITPTSDFVEDSSEIQDLANSSQSTGMYSADSTSNIKTNSNFQMQNNHAIMTNKNSDCTISDFSQTVATEEKVFTSSGTVVQNSSPSPTSSTGSLYSSSTNSTSPSSNSSTPHQHFHKKYLREEHAKTLKQLSNSFVTPTKQQFSPIESESLEDRSYQNTPTKNGYSMSSPTPSYTSESQDYHNFNYSNKTSPSPQSPSKMQQSKQKHPTNVPYDPLVHVTSKPPYSFSSLIFMAIENAQQKALPVKEIYAWIIQNFPYFKTAPTGWKNSVRHNLSLNKCFQKVEKAANLGKGSLWMVEQQYRPNLLQALSRSPYHPCLDKTVYKSNNSSSAQRPIEMASNGANSKSSNRLPDPEHFPYLSRRLAALGQATEDDDDDDYNESRSTTPIDYENENHYINNTIVLNNNGNSWRADSIEDVNAATAMLALKHGPKIFNDEFHNGNPPVITTSPSEDHTYSAGGTLGNRSKSSSDNNSNGSSAYESSEESQNLHIDDIEEQRRQAGVDALLNLAGIATTDYTNINTHTITPTSSPLKRPASSVQYTTTYVLNDGQMTHNRSYYITEDVNQYSSPPKKSKSRMMKSKLKKKAWMR